MGIPITDTYIAVKNNTAGALISWFYTPNDIYTSGGQYMVKMINGYNLNKGTQHNWGTVSQVVGIPIHTIWAEHWAKIFCFDTLRGERDRHQDNWGLIRPKNTELDDWTSYRFSPAFDNGTSLGYELDERRILKTSKNIDAYILNKKAQHHMKWSLDDNKTYNHLDFMINFIRHYPEFKSIIDQSLNFDFDQFAKIVNHLTTLSVPCNLSKLRAEFMIELILSRVLKLKEMLKREFD